MHSPFTFNSNAHRSASEYQQQSVGYQKPVYNIGASHIFSGFMNHQPNLIMNQHSFVRSFASVVSSDSSLKPQNNNMFEKVNQENSNNSGFLGSIFKHFSKPQHTISHHPQTSSHKYFEDFTQIPCNHLSTSLQNSDFQKPNQKHYYNHQQQQQTNHINTKPSNFTKSEAHQLPHHSANTQNTTKNFMTSFFGNYQRQHKYPPNQKWQNRSYRCFNKNGRWRGRNNNKFHDHDVNLPKNSQEKDRVSVEHDIQSDCCDFVNVPEVDDMNEIKEHSKELSKDSSDTSKEKYHDNEMKEEDPPFLIYSIEEFPAIPPPTQTLGRKKETICSAKKQDEGFVVVPTEASASTPSFIPKRLSLCEKIIKSPQKLFPKPTPLNLKPCIKPTRRKMSESSDDFIVFADDGDDCEFDEDSYCEDETESDDSDDESVIYETNNIEDISEEDESSEDESTEEKAIEFIKSPELHLDSGFEEKKVRFNMTPKVHVMRAWDYAYRACRKGDYWQQFARDNERFKKRILEKKKILDPILNAEHRRRIFHERFLE